MRLRAVTGLTAPPLAAVPLLTVLLALLLAAGQLGAAAAPGVELDSRAFEIARKLRCPVCVSESVADSSAQLAQQMRVLIQEQLEQGRSDEEIYAYFTARYGDWILLEPPRRGLHLVVWLLPAVALATGLGALALLARRWLRRADSTEPVEAADLARVRAELALGAAAPGASGVLPTSQAGPAPDERGAAGPDGGG